MRTDDSPRARMREALDAAVWHYTASAASPVVGWMSDLDVHAPPTTRAAFYQRWVHARPTPPSWSRAMWIPAVQYGAWRERTTAALHRRALPERKPRTEPVQQGMRRIELKAPAEQAQCGAVFQNADFSCCCARCQHRPGQRRRVGADGAAAVLSGYDNARLDRGLNPDHRPCGRQRGCVLRPGVARSAGVHPLCAYLPAGVCGAGRGGLACTGGPPGTEGVPQAELQRVKNQWVASEVYKQRQRVQPSAHPGTPTGSTGFPWTPTPADRAACAP